jgi:hypothetical protein
MSYWRRAQELDQNARVGLTFISIGYGVVLVAVFPMKPPAQLDVVDWFHLALAAFVLVISYMGYYSNRQKFPSWMVKFFNIPLLQCLISFGILFLYWELGIISSRGGPRATPWPEAFIVLLVFLAYLAWDFLEVTVQESWSYIEVLIRTGNSGMLPPLTKDYTQGGRSGHPVRTRRPIPWFAKDVRASRTVTLVFTCLYLVLLAVAGHVHGTVGIAAFDSGYIVTLFAYRYAQWAWSKFWYRHV